MIIPQSAWLFDIGAVLLVLWTLRLVRRDRLYVGYGVLVLLVLGASVLTFSVVRLSVVTVAGLLLAALLFIYILGQMTVLSNRLTQVVQELALKDVQPPAPPAGAAISDARSQHR